MDMMKLPKFNQYWLEIVFIFIVGLVPLLWHKPGYIALGHDMSFPLAPVDYFKDRLFTWTNRTTFGANQTDSINGIFIHGIDAFLSSVTPTPFQGQKIAFVFWFTLPGISMYILSRKIYQKPFEWPARLSTTTVYMINYFLLQGWIIAERTKFSIYSALPIFVLFSVKALFYKKSLILYSLLISLLFVVLNGGAGLPLWGGVAALYLAIGLAYYIYSLADWKHKLLRIFGLSILVFIWTFIFNLYWVVPYTISFQQNYTQRVNATGGIGGLIGWSRAISVHTGYLNLLRMQGIPDWYDNLEHPYSPIILNNPVFVFLSFLFIALSTLGLFLVQKDRKDQNNIFPLLGLLGLIISIPLSAGSHTPSGWIYEMLLRYLPGFSIFRTPFYKFGMVIWFSYAILIGSGLKYIQKFWTKLAPFAVIAFFFSWGMYHFAAFNGNFFNWSPMYSTMVKVPDYVYQFKQWVEKNNFSTRTVLIPRLDGRTFYEIYNWKYFSLSTITSILTRKSIVVNDVALQERELILVEKMYKQLRETGESPLIGFLGIDGALLREDTAIPEDIEFSSRPLVDKFKISTQFNMVQSWGKWSAFETTENSQLRPKINVPTSITKLNIFTKDLSNVLDYLQFKPNFAFVMQEDVGSSLNDLNLQLQQIISKAECTNCDKVPQFTVDVNPPLILPGSRLRGFYNSYRDYLRSKISNPGELIDFDLGYVVKDAKALDSLIKKRGETRPISSTINEWKQLINTINSNLAAIADGKTKEQYIYKVNAYIEYLKRYVVDWQNSSLPESYLTQFIEFVATADLFQDRISSLTTKSSDDLFSSYSINISNEAEKKIVINTDKIQNLDKILVDNSWVQIKPIPGYENWYISPPVKFSSGEHVIKTNVFDNSNLTNLSQVKFFEAELNSKGNKCLDTILVEKGKESGYKVSFRLTSSTERMDYDIHALESNSNQKDGVSKTLYLEYPKTFGDYTQIQTNYFPSQEATRLDLKICPRFEKISKAKITIDNISVIADAEFPQIFVVEEQPDISVTNPTVKFLSINQTKYLVKIDSHTQPLVLDFDARYDSEWNLVKLDLNPLTFGFSGENRQYRAGLITEYLPGDNQSILPNRPSVLNTQFTHFKIDGYANGWIIPPSQTPDVYLIEYKLQNTLQKSVKISMLFIMIAGVYVAKISLDKFRHK